MPKLKAKIVNDTKVVVFHPSPNRVSHDDENAPPLKRRAPKRHKPKPNLPRKDD